RESKQLRYTHARPAIDPARSRQAEPIGEEARHRAGATEQQDDGEADDKRRCDNREHSQGAQRGFEPKTRARDDQRASKAQRRRARRDDERKKKAVPRDTAAQSARYAIEAPDRAIKEQREEVHWSKTAGIVLERAREHLGDREEHEEPDHREDQAERRSGEGVPAGDAARGEAMAHLHQERE